ncbi:MAG TPA: aminopeptidase, partial [Segetibacter sp.]
MLLLLLAGTSYTQALQKIINVQEVRRVETALSADSMLGRRTFSPGSEKAARFIAKEFKNAGLQHLSGLNTFHQSFVVVKPKLVSISAVFKGSAIDTDKVMAITSLPDLKLTPAAGFEKATIDAGANLFEKASDLIG